MAESKWNPDRARRLLAELGLTRHEPLPQRAMPTPGVEPRSLPNQQERDMNTPAVNPRFAPPHADSTPSAPVNTPNKAVTSVLGPTLRFKGELVADEDLLIQGQLEGSIEHTRSLTIGTEGGVKGNIHARIVIIDGTVEGDIHGLESVTVRETARVRGNIFAPRVGLADGAKFTGRVDRDTAEAAAAGSPSRSRGQSSSDVLSDTAAHKILASGS